MLPKARVLSMLPLTALSVAWTFNLITPETKDAVAGGPRLPDVAAVPAEAIEAPASYSRPGRVGLGVPRGSASRVVAASSTNGIPAAALAAYQRAETVIDAADRACGLDWQLVAAIGRVESDHGRYGGSTLGRDGISRPGIYGIAVAATWSEVGVDADGDGKRNPQDVDDAALASAVYLCSGEDDLGTVAGRRAAVHRYNHSRAYVDLVLAVREAYLEGDYVAVPSFVTSAVTFTPDHSFPHSTGTKAGKPKDGKTSGSTGSGGTSGGSSSGAPTQQPTSPTPAPEQPATNDPVRQLEETVKKTVEDTTATLEDTVSGVLSLPQAILACTAEGLTALTTPTRWNACIDRHAVS